MNIIDALCERYSSDYRRMAAALDKTLAEIDRLRLENANLRLENRQLRRLLKDHELRMLRRAERDALLIGALHFGGNPTSKRTLQTVGMGENRWCLARALLMYGGGLRRDGSIKPDTSDGYIACVQHGVEVVADGGAFMLKNASYRHRRRRRGALGGAPIGANARQQSREKGGKP